MVGTTLTLEKSRSGSRKGCPNHSPEFRRRMVDAACEPGVSVSSLARENGLNANLLFRWRREHRVKQQGKVGGLIPVSVVKDVASVVAPEALIEPDKAKATSPGGTIEVRIGRAMVKVDGAVDVETLRAVLASLRS
jgi:transposase